MRIYWHLGIWYIETREIKVLFEDLEPFYYLCSHNLVSHLGDIAVLLSML